MTEPIQIAFVCVQNAGRSQMAYAFAQRELEARDVEREVSIITGGTRPADDVHSVVSQAMQDVGIDISARTPRAIRIEELQRSDYVITMGCSTADICPAGWAGASRDWDLDDPAGQPPDAVARIRDEIERRVDGLFDELIRND